MRLSVRLNASNKIQWCPFSNVNAPRFDQISYNFAFRTVFEVFVFWELGQNFVSFCENKETLIFARKMKSESSL